MEPRTALLADPNEETTLALEALLSADFRVLRCADGQTALELVGQEQPELLILELSLPRLDGISLLRELSRRESRPCVLVLTFENSPYVLRALQTLPVDYVMLKPSPIRIVVERAKEILEPQAEADDWFLRDLLNRLSIPESSQGFRHLMAGLPMLVEQWDQFLGKTLYLEIARQNRVSNESVEKAIRDAIHAGWNKGDRGLWLHYFPNSVRAPQNKQFLTRMAGVLCRHRRCG